MASLHSSPWIIARDFNEVLADNDKFGGKTINANRSLLFKDCLDSCNMVDLGFSGPRFTWSNRRGVRGLIQERLDRFFVNPGWCTLYPNARVSHLTRVHSDHCPVLLDFDPGVDSRLNRPFKFQSFWLNDLTFPSIVRDTWGRTNCLEKAVEKFAKDATDWNRNHFGNIFAKKRRVMARLDGAQKALVERPSNFLVELEKDLQRELNEVLNQEQELWALKSRMNCMVLGDRNTSFFHVSTIVRRRRN